MSNYLEAPTEVARPRLSTASTLARFALIGIALVAVAGSFAYLGGWFSPNDLTPARVHPPAHHCCHPQDLPPLDADRSWPRPGQRWPGLPKPRKTSVS